MTDMTKSLSEKAEEKECQLKISEEKEKVFEEMKILFCKTRNSGDSISISNGNNSSYDNSHVYPFDVSEIKDISSFLELFQKQR